MRSILKSLVLTAGLTAATFTLAERPGAMRLYPSRSVVFVRTPDGAEFIDKFQSSRFFQDPEIAPFLGSLFGKIDEAYQSGPGEVTGGGISDLMQLAQGEVAFGVVPRRNEGPGLLFLADTVSAADREANDSVAIAEGLDRATHLFDSIRAAATKDGDVRIAEEQVATTKVTVFRRGDKVRAAVGFAEREGVLIFSNDRILLESLITKWDEAEGLAAIEPVAEQATEEETEIQPDDDERKRAERLRQRYTEPLADNPGFTESLRECVSERIGGGDDTPPQLTIFVDPVGIFRAVAQQNAGMRIALATLPVLGLDKIEGASAAMWIDQGDWDSLIRAHLLLGTPRSGVLKMLRLKPCDPTPGKAIPDQVATYQCGAVDFAATLEGAGKLYDRIRGEGEFAKLVEEQFTKRTGLIPTETLEQLTGRFVSLQAYGDIEEGAAPRVTPARAILLDVEDPEWAKRTLRETLDRIKVSPKWDEHGGVEYARLAQPEADSEEGRRRQRRRGGPFAAHLAVIGEQFVYAETEALLHKLIDTHAGIGPRLAEHLPYRLTASRTKRLGKATVGGEEGRIVKYEDPSTQFRQWHVAGNSDASREQLDRMAEFAPPMRWLRDALDETGVPPLEALMRHAAPAGAAIYDTPRGFRFVQFNFRMEEE
ncbi:hypothetical protein MalM25_16470 [Planctomycetes bacterium MalM25]|nr:hypothetical protein MalM25_16470 [Planctomycetes bacterium MalM25]